MFNHDTKESQEGKVALKEVDSECVKSCIESIYSGSFDIPDGKIGDLIHVAIMMQLDDVKNAIRDIMAEDLTAENFYETKNIAEIYDLVDLASQCKLFYEDNFIEISALPGFVNETKSHLVSILKSKKLGLSEAEKLMVSLRWVGENTEKKENLFQLVKLIDLTTVSTEYLGDLLQHHPFISNDLHLFKLLNSPMVDALKQAKAQAVKTLRSIRPTTDGMKVVSNAIILFDDGADCLRCYDPTTNNVEMFHDAKLRNLIHFTAVYLDPYIYILITNRFIV